MARRRARDGEQHPPETPPVEAGAAEFDELLREAEASGTTGELLVLFRPDAAEAAVRAIRDQAGVATVSTAESDEGFLSAADVGDRGLVFDKLGVAVLPVDADQAQAVAAVAEDSGIQFSRPERLVYAISEAAFVPGQLDPTLPVPPGSPPLPMPVVPGTPPLAVQVPGAPGFFPASAVSLEYLIGYRDAILQLVGGLTGIPTVPGAPTFAFAPGMPVSASAAAAAAGAAAAFADTTEGTWGLQAIRALNSRWTGRGVKIAILDTGLDLTHPDFRGRVSASKSFIPGQEVQDRHGHGTHCAGTACGPLTPSSGRRYGVAPRAELYVGKVLGNAGKSVERSVLAGINWAISQGCRIASLSLSVLLPGGAPDPIYRDIATRAIRAGTALIAAAGNDSDRRVGNIQPVASPANSPFFMAAGAVDRNFRMAYFSNGAGPNSAHGIDLVGPGVDVYSAWSQTAKSKPGFPPPGLYATISGTSQATPHVAGVGALIAEAQPDYDAADILNGLLLLARSLPLPSGDVGKGLVQAPR